MKKLLLFFTFQLVAMEQEQPQQQIQSLETFVYSLNNTPEAIKILPLEIEQHCIAMHVMHHKQLWYPTKTIPLSHNRIDAAYFSNDSSHVFLNAWNIPTQKNQLQKLDLNSDIMTVIPTPINCKNFSAIPSNDNKLYALMQHHKESIYKSHSQIHVIDAQTNSLIFSFPPEDKDIHSVQWSADNNCFMSCNGDIWNIKTKNKKVIMPAMLGFIAGEWDNEGTKMIFHRSKNLIWDTLSETVLAAQLPIPFGSKKWNRNNTKIAYQDTTYDHDHSILVYDSATGEKLSTIKPPFLSCKFYWKNNTEIFVYGDNPIPYKDSSIMIINVLSEQFVTNLHNTPKIDGFCCNQNGTLFLAWNHAFNNPDKNSYATLWQRYTEFTPQQAFFYWLLHKWVLLKKLNSEIDSMKKLLDDIVSYLPLDKIALLTIWKTFPKVIRKTIWEYKMNYFIEHKYHKPQYHRPTTYELFRTMTECDSYNP